MTTPSYVGTTQSPAAGGGLLARIGSYFGGGGTPAYGGNGQPSPVMGSPFSGMSPMYAPAPERTNEPQPSTSMMACACTQLESQESTCLIDAEALAAGQIAIVIPRQD